LLNLPDQPESGCVSPGLMENEWGSFAASVVFMMALLDESNLPSLATFSPATLQIPY
jgi:hypothetical protein